MKAVGVKKSSLTIGKGIIVVFFLLLMLMSCSEEVIKNSDTGLVNYKTVSLSSLNADKKVNYFPQIYNDSFSRGNNSFSIRPNQINALTEFLRELATEINDIDKNNDLKLKTALSEKIPNTEKIYKNIDYALKDSPMCSILYLTGIDKKIGDKYMIPFTESDLLLVISRLFSSSALDDVIKKIKDSAVLKDQSDLFIDLFDNLIEKLCNKYKNVNSAENEVQNQRVSDKLALAYIYDILDNYLKILEENLKTDKLDSSVSLYTENIISDLAVIDYICDLNCAD